MTSRDPRRCCEAVQSAILATAWLLVVIICDGRRVTAAGACCSGNPPGRAPTVILFHFNSPDGDGGGARSAGGTGDMQALWPIVRVRRSESSPASLYARRPQEP